MPDITFYKMHGAGNDFVLIDNRNGVFPAADRGFIRQLCQRHTGIGADGLMLLENTTGADFAMRYFNADGSAGEMCGNGARCAAALAKHLGIAAPDMQFTVLGVRYFAGVIAPGIIQLGMPPAIWLAEATELQNLCREPWRSMALLDVGVPHLVVDCPVDPDTLDIVADGQFLREHPRFQPRGTNVNFIRRLDNRRLQVRVYERGVEAETLACGTGAVACSIFAAHYWGFTSPVEVISPGGQLSIDLANQETILLTGPAELVYEGQCAANLQSRL